MNTLSIGITLLAIKTEQIKVLIISAELLSLKHRQIPGNCHHEKCVFVFLLNVKIYHFLQYIFEKCS